MANNNSLLGTVRTATAALVGGAALFATLGLASTGAAAATNSAAAPATHDVALASFVTAAPAPGCRPGFVWRDARDGDGVCVTPQDRDEVHRENAAAQFTHLPGTNGCQPGYVWRDAWNGDGV
jgi:hypothetical protein